MPERLLGLVFGGWLADALDRTTKIVMMAAILMIINAGHTTEQKLGVEQPKQKFKQDASMKIGAEINIKMKTESEKKYKENMMGAVAMIATRTMVRLNSLLRLRFFMMVMPLKMVAMSVIAAKNAYKNIGLSIGFENPVDSNNPIRVKGIDQKIR